MGEKDGKKRRGQLIFQLQSGSVSEQCLRFLLYHARVTNDQEFSTFSLALKRLLPSDIQWDTVLFKYIRRSIHNMILHLYCYIMSKSAQRKTILFQYIFKKNTEVGQV